MHINAASWEVAYIRHAPSDNDKTRQIRRSRLAFPRNVSVVAVASRMVNRNDFTSTCSHLTARRESRLPIANVFSAVVMQLLLDALCLKVRRARIKI